MPKKRFKAYGLDAPGTYSTTATFFNMDNDGDLDMFLANHADMFYNPFYNTEKLRATGILSLVTGCTGMITVYLKILVKRRILQAAG
jgi:hypothetical protein